MNLEFASAMPTGTGDAVLNALPLPVIVVSADGKITEANVAAEKRAKQEGPSRRGVHCRGSDRKDEARLLAIGKAEAGNTGESGSRYRSKKGLRLPT